MSVLLEVNHLSISFLQYTRGFQQKKAERGTGAECYRPCRRDRCVSRVKRCRQEPVGPCDPGDSPGQCGDLRSIRYDGEELTTARQAALRGREIALVPQSVNYLNPLMRVGEQVRTNRGDAKEAVKKQREIFERYGLGAEVERMFPFQLSGGMARRILVSTASMSGAKLVIADEPTPGLDAGVVKETLGFFKELADQGCGVLFITHDIEAALQIAHKVAIIYAGTTVETARPDDFAGSGEKLRHPYSKALWRALPQNGFEPIPGFQPHPDALPEGCRFAPRCPMATNECMNSLPRCDGCAADR